MSVYSVWTEYTEGGLPVQLVGLEFRSEIRGPPINRPCERLRMAKFLGVWETEA
jgi:hypothetical protein